jgi:hypothetical protein
MVRMDLSYDRFAKTVNSLSASIEKSLSITVPAGSMTTNHGVPAVR